MSKQGSSADRSSARADQPTRRDATSSASANANSIANTNTNNWMRNGYGEVNPTTGKFSAAESQTVKTAIEDYCNSHGVTPSRLCSDSDNRTDHLRGAWMDIAQKLPHRTVQSVYRHGLRLMHPFKRGAWSEDETNELLLLVTIHGKKWSEIQSKLNRSADSCRDKHREFHMDYTKGKWGDEESLELINHVKECLKVGENLSLEELGKLADQDSAIVPWSVISQKMKNRSRLSCFKRFQLVTGLKKAMLPSSTTTTSSENATVVNTGTAKKRKRVAATAEPAVKAAFAVNEDNASTSGNDDDEPLYVKFPDSDPIPATEPLPIQADPLVVADVTAYDRQLLNHLATSSFTQESEVNWSVVRYPYGDAKGRYEELLDKWIEAYGVDEDEVMDRPLWEVAKEILNQGEVAGIAEEDQAELAARTVEAVFLY